MGVGVLGGALAGGEGEAGMQSLGYIQPSVPRPHGPD